MTPTPAPTADPSLEPHWLPAWQAAEGTRRVEELFAQWADSEPAVLASAPGRVNLIGEHVDYNGGLCLPIAIDHRTYVALRPREDGRIRLLSAQRPEVWEIAASDVNPGDVSGWGAYVAGVAWALEQAGHRAGGFDAVVDSCVPFGAGLSSSAALEASIAVALDAVHAFGLAGDDTGRRALAAACVRAENEIAGAATGGMDQAASLRSRPGMALALDCQDGSVHHEPFDPEGLELLVIDTRAPHALVDGQYAERRATCERAAATLGVRDLRDLLDEHGLAAGLERAHRVLEGDLERRRATHVLTEIERTREAMVAMQRGEWGRFGTLMDASHESLAKDYEVTVPELDVAVAAARAAGAVGARMTGGGFGGSAIALVTTGTADTVAAEVSAAFAAQEFAAPAFLTSRAAGPATAH